MQTLLSRSFLYLLFVLLFSGCWREDKPVTKHFWRYVNGVYHSEQTGQYLDFNQRDQSVQIFQPIFLMDSPLCYVAADIQLGDIISEGSGPMNKKVSEVGLSEGVLLAKVLHADAHSRYYKEQSLTDDEAEICDTAVNILNRNLSRARDGLYIPIIAYGGAGLILKNPIYCDFSYCRRIDEMNFDGYFGRSVLPDFMSESL